MQILFAVLFVFGCAETKTQQYPELSPEQKAKAEAEYPDELPKAKPDPELKKAAEELVTVVQDLEEELKKSDGQLDRVAEALDAASGSENPPKKIWVGGFIINFHHGDTPEVVILFPTKGNIWDLLAIGVRLNAPEETMSDNGLEWTFHIQDQDNKITSKKILVKDGKAYVVLKINDCEITLHTFFQPYHHDFAPCVEGICGNFYSSLLNHIAHIQGDCEGIVGPAY